MKAIYFVQCFLSSKIFATAYSQDWYISKADYPIALGFSNSTQRSELVFGLNVTDSRTGLIEMEVLDHETCSIPIDPDVLTLTVNSTGIEYPGDGYSTVPIVGDLDVGLLTFYENTTLYMLSENKEEAKLKFCVRSDLGVVRMEDGGFSSISFAAFKFDITVSLIAGFTPTAINVELLDPNLQVSTVDIDYGLYACQCNETNRVCDPNPQPKPQNSPVHICIITDVNDVTIRTIKKMYLTQEGISLAIIEDSIPNIITTTSEMGTKNEVVSTRLVSTFFAHEGDELPPVEAHGVAVMDFESTSRKLFRIESTRGLQNYYNTENEDSFSVLVELVSDGMDIMEQEVIYKNVTLVEDDEDCIDIPYIDACLDMMLSIIISAIATVALIGFVCVCCCCCYRKKRSKEEKRDIIINIVNDMKERKTEGFETIPLGSNDGNVKYSSNVTTENSEEKTLEDNPDDEEMPCKRKSSITIDCANED